jgi:hypothetical protein
MNSCNTQRTNELLQAAKNYAQLGLPVFPLHHITDSGKCSCGGKDCDREGKHPRTSRGLYDASTDEATICQFWRRFPLANVGIRTGDSIGVLDIDPRHNGTESFRVLESKIG